MARDRLRARQNKRSRIEDEQSTAFSLVAAMEREDTHLRNSQELQKNKQKQMVKNGSCLSIYLSIYLLCEDREIDNSLHIGNCYDNFHLFIFFDSLTTASNKNTFLQDFLKILKHLLQNSVCSRFKANLLSHSIVLHILIGLQLANLQTNYMSVTFSCKLS